jgi:WD40 repeat protein
MIISGGNGGVVNAYDTRYGGDVITVDKRFKENNELWSLSKAHHVGITAMCMDPSETVLVTAAADGEIKLWDITSKALLLSVQENDHRSYNNVPVVADVALTPLHLYTCGGSGKLIMRQLFY